MSDQLLDEIRSLHTPLAEPADLDALLDTIGNSRYVLLGEATHGTAEFYDWRTEITKQLIERRNFSFVAVEGDWPDCYRINRFVRGLQSGTAEDALRAFARWPTWMWANRQVVELVRWMREWNDQRPVPGRAGFYGLDVYSLWDSMEAVLEYLSESHPDAVGAARRAYSCFEPYAEDVQEYARATALVPTSCENEAITILRELRTREPQAGDGDEDREAWFNAEQNALIARNAEMYYRTMVRGGPASWNIRDTHMVETLERLMEHHGPRAKAIVWEHNTHIGDARFTDMARAGMINVGQLVRQRHAPDGVVLVGFGTHHGSVMAAREWGAPMQRMRVPDARDGSFEDAMFQAGTGDSLLRFGGETRWREIEALNEPRGHRAIGVVYDPAFESWGNYVPTIMPQRYDAFLYIAETRAVDPLHVREKHGGEVPETFPTGQ